MALAHSSGEGPIRVWNGIFAAGDWRPESDLKTISPNRDRNSETGAREKWPQKRPSCLKVRTRARTWDPPMATITGHSLRDVHSILDANYLHRDAALGESAIRKLERGI